ncbi:MAG: DUF4154 domain-containing protein [Colwellia sp.]|nr:DUF4154 domain-containing protein [Colwellia sp.]
MKRAIMNMALIVSLLLFSQSAISFQQDVSNKVKAAFVFNFIKYVEWPNEKNIANFTIGFYGDDKAFIEALQQMHNMKVRHFIIQVIKITSIEQEKKLHIIVLDKTQSKNIMKIAMQLNEQATLIISDNAADKKNTMLNFIESENNKIVFEMNRYQMVNAKLKSSPDILVLGGTELDIARVLKEMDETITNSLHEIQAQSLRLQSLKDDIIEREKQFTLQQTKSELQQNEIRIQQEQLTSQNKQLKTQKNELTQSKKDVQSLQDNYKQVKQELGVSRVQLTNNKESLYTLKSDIQQKERSILNLGVQINERKSLLKHLESQHIIQKMELAKQTSVIQTQYIVIIITIIASLAILILLIVIYKSRKIQHQINQELHINIEALAEANLKLSTAQDQLVESEKMAALGGLVAGVAHEINTPIGICVTAASHLSEGINVFETEYKTGQLKKSSLEQLLSDAQESSAMLMRNLHRAAELISNFKQVAVDQSSEKRREFELKSYIEELIHSLRPQFKQGSHIISVISNNKITLNGFPGVIAQIMTNLIMNSTLHGFKDTSHGEIFIELSLENGEVTIDFRDNGVGLTEQQREKVFEPFYTTTRSTGGSGLGMSISYNLITGKLNGTFNCLNPSKGAHFIITFPQ